MILLQSHKGTYILVLHLPRRTRFPVVGPFGTVILDAGYYCYVGTAHGSGGVRGRVGHHLRTPKAKRRWHIDYVRDAMQVLEVWVTYDLVKRECQWSSLVFNVLKGAVPVPGFGSADCDICPAHFCRFDSKPLFTKFATAIKERIPGHAPAYRCRMPARR